MSVKLGSHLKHKKKIFEEKKVIVPTFSKFAITKKKGKEKGNNEEMTMVLHHDVQLGIALKIIMNSLLSQKNLIQLGAVWIQGSGRK